MPRPKNYEKRATVTEYEQALMEVIERARSMNIPRNSISQAMTFGLMLSTKLFPGRDPKRRSPEFNELVSKVVEDARVERAEAELARQEAIEREKHKIILTGHN